MHAGSDTPDPKPNELLVAERIRPAGDLHSVIILEAGSSWTRNDVRTAGATEGDSSCVTT